MSRTFYGGEALPLWSVGYPGHTSIPAFLGCPTTLDFNTGWWYPVFNESSWDARSLNIDKNGHWWKFTIQSLKTGVDASKDKCLVSTGAFGGPGDTLAALIGTNRLLIDVIDDAEKVADAEMFLIKMWEDVFDELYTITGKANDGGSTGWFDLWSPGKFYASQCDFSYMISPEMFRRIFIPAIKHQTDFLTHSVYHVDGIEAFRHIKHLVELPNLQAIQVAPGAGKPSPLHYMDYLKEVQSAGRNLHISIPAEEVKDALDSLSAKGLFIATSCESEESARALLQKAEEWSRP